MLAKDNQMLFYTKIEKFGMLTTMLVLIAIFMFITGMGYLGAPLIIAAGVLADLIAKSGKHKSFKKTALSLFGALGTLPPATSALLHNTSTVLLGMDCMTNLLQDTKKP